MTPELPSLIGRYRILQSLASGVGGGVYRAFDPMIERPVAVKFLPVAFGDRAAESHVKECFYREMRRAGTLMHPAVATLFDIGEVAGGLFMASELVEGPGSLADWLVSRRETDLQPRVTMLAQIADALEYARDLGVPHLNLKATNVLVSADRSIKVGGFGIARVLDAFPSPRRALLRISRYTAPERVEGQTGDARCDVFALAAIAVEVLGGAPLYAGEPAELERQMGHAVLSAPPHFAMLGIDAARWRAVFGPALATDPADRFETPAAFLGALMAALGVIRAPGTRAWRTTSRSVVAGATPDQLRDIDLAATDPGLSVFARSTEADPAMTEGRGTASALSGVEPDGTPTVRGHRETPGCEIPSVPVASAALPLDPRVTVYVKTGAPPAPDVKPAPPESLPAPTGEGAQRTVLRPADLPPADHTTLTAPPGPIASETILIPGRAATPDPPPMPLPDLPIAGASVSHDVPSARAVVPVGSPRRSRAVVGLALLGVAVAAVAWFNVRGLRTRVVGEATLPDQPASTLTPASNPPSRRAAGGPGTIQAGAAGSAAREALADRIADRSTAQSASPGLPAAAGAPEPAIRTSGGLRIVTTPAGAIVTIDGRVRGSTPIRMRELTFAEHVISVALDGYARQEERVRLTPARADRTLDMTLAPLVTTPTTGGMSITSEPGEARVTVDGVAAGATPAALSGLTPGLHALRAEHEGFEPLTRDVEVRSGQTTAVALRLTEIAPPPAAPAAPADPISFEVVQVKPRQTAGAATPPYPRAAAQARMSGAITVSWVVDERGAMTDIKVLEASAPLFEEEIRAWLGTIRFAPGRQGGRPAKVLIQRRFRFEPARRDE